MTRPPIPDIEEQRDLRERAGLRQVAGGGPGAETALRTLFLRYRRPMLAFFRAQGLTAAEAEDMVQDVFLRVVRSAGTYRGESRAAAWLWSIARNRLVDHWRARAPEALLDDEGWTLLNETVAAGRSSSEGGIEDCVARAFATYTRLHPDRAEALRRVAVEGWSMAEIATFLRRSEGAAREYISQCRKKLRPLLEPCLEALHDR